MYVITVTLKDRARDIMRHITTGECGKINSYVINDYTKSSWSTIYDAWVSHAYILKASSHKKEQQYIYIYLGLRHG